jgi:hypothetical protein
LAVAPETEVPMEAEKGVDISTDQEEVVVKKKGFWAWLWGK